MNSHDEKPILDSAIQSCFATDARFIPIDDRRERGAHDIAVAFLEKGEVEPSRLESDHLPYLCVPEDRPEPVDAAGKLVLVAVEGQDREMATTVGQLLDARTAGIGLMHVTWMPPTVESPLGPAGLDDPAPGELLLYRGAREALVGTAQELRRSGFEVSTHLREDRDPARPLVQTILEQRPDLVVLGLGRHGAGIGHRILEHARVPLLFVRAR